MRLQIKTKVPTKIYGDAIKIAKNQYKMEKNDITVKIQPRWLMQKIQDKYKEIQTKTNEVSLLDIFQVQQ